MPLEVVKLTVSIEGRRILSGVTLKVDKGRVLAVMGPNGSGKTSLLYTIMGHPRYKVVDGDILLDGESIRELPPHERARRGVMLGFQNPVEVPGVKLSTLMLAAWNKLSGKSDLLKLDPRFSSEVEKLREVVGLAREFLYREVNVGFSGGERKRSEVLQLLALKPRYVLLDEPDSGLDVDGVRTIARAVDMMRDEGRGILLVTHYARILEYVEPDEVVVLVGGRVVDRGGPELAMKVEREGYSAYVSGS
jgi:Fe-S cluster assembly ATP-binding protein